MQNEIRLIDANALKNAFANCTLTRHLNIYYDGIIADIIDNAPTVKPEITVEQAISKIQETDLLSKHDKILKEWADMKCEYCNKNIRPQGDIRWTDKLSVKSNGDIIDFEGRVVGHIDLEVMKGGAENETDN